MPAKASLPIPSRWLFVLAALGIFLVYAPIVGNQFLSDDYDSLYRILVKKEIIYREYLRPMCDVTFYLNYLISGLSPVAYYLFNIAMHVVCCGCLYRLGLQLPVFEPRRRPAFAALGALLFAVYPFHNESIAWLSGRLSTMACCCALLSLTAALRRPGVRGYTIAIAWYFFGLLSYESIALLPFVWFVLTWESSRSPGEKLRRFVGCIAVVAAYLALHRQVSGVVTGDYGARVGLAEIGRKAGNLAKVFGRLFLPATERSGWLIAGSVCVAIALGLAYRRLRNTGASDGFSPVAFRKLVFALGVSLAIPVAFGISTRTSEGDRLLYFPSAFLCLSGAALLLQTVRTKTTRAWIAAALCLLSVELIEANNFRWKQASRSAGNILSVLSAHGAGDAFVVNLPDENEGAYIFRNGFRRALVLRGIDTSRVFVASVLKRLDYLGRPDPLEPVGAQLPPQCVLAPGASPASVDLINHATGKTLVVRKSSDTVYFWNRRELVVANAAGGLVY